TGAGINGGQVIGASDEFGYKAMEQPISYHDLHATLLHLLGVDHTKLTYRFNGRDMRLTDVYGTLIPQITNAYSQSNREERGARRDFFSVAVCASRFSRFGL